MLFIPEAGESCWVLGKGRNIPRELLARGGTGSSVSSALRHAEQPGTEGHQRDPRGPAQSPSPLEDVGGGSGLSKAPRNTRDPLWDCTWIGLRSHQNLLKELHWCPLVPVGNRL